MEDVKEIIKGDIERLEKYQRDLETAEFILNELRRQKETRHLMVDAFLFIADARRETLEKLERRKTVLSSLEPSGNDYPF